MTRPDTVDRAPGAGALGVRATTLVWAPVIVLVPASLANLWVPGATSPQNPAVVFALFSAITAVFGGVGALVVSRRPANAIGWILWLVGLLIGLTLACAAYAALSVAWFGGTLTGTLAAAWITSWSLSPPLAIALLFIPLLFPDGHLPSRRWRGVLVAFVAIALEVGLPDMIRPGPVSPTTMLNPIAWRGDPRVLDALTAISQLSAPVGLPVAIAAAVIRFRRGSTVERQQLKWFGATAALTATALSVAMVTPDPIAISAFATAMVGMALIPISIGIAILRYRLYDIDRIVSRTLSWAMVTGVLAAVFGGGLVALQAALAGVTQGGTLAVAASTLAAFAVFQPVRRRVQRIVDRRFDRARYDAQRTADGFAERLRNEVDLATVGRVLTATAAEAVRPASSGVWLREGPVGRR